MEQVSIKKAIALSFLLLAGAVILAHAVVPHHHHGGIPCISYSNNHLSDQHRSDTNEDCLLSKVYLRWCNDKQIFQLYDDFNFFPCFFTLFSDNSTSQIKDNGALPFEQKPFLLSRHTEFIARSTGLRAPPVSITN